MDAGVSVLQLHLIEKS